MGLLRRSGGGTLDALIVGLGNPGRQYAKTRHNIGFLVVDLLAERAGASFRAKYDGRFAETTIADARVALLEPETFMNLSGRSVQRRRRASTSWSRRNVIVVYDEIELDFDKVRAKAGGGLKGHNGLRSLADSLGSPDFLRVRCGVGRPRRGDPRSVADYVLGAFYEDEDPAGMIGRAADCVETILADGIDEAERRFSVLGRTVRHVGHRPVGPRVGAGRTLERGHAPRHQQLAAALARVRGRPAPPARPAPIPPRRTGAR